MEKLKNELTLGKELAKQLKIHHSTPSSSNETRELLINKILNSYDKALQMLNVGGGGTVLQSHVTGGIKGEGLLLSMSESPRSLSLSPRSDDSDHDFKNKSMGKQRKRKGMPRWTRHVQISPGSGLEGPLDDGYNWRKYGQKDILGAKYPRGYYRCTLRQVHGCMATKQVQRTDDDQTIFEITYRGTHICNQNPDPKPSPPPSTSVNQDPASSSATGSHQKHISPPPQQNHNADEKSLLRFSTAAAGAGAGARGLKVRTENLEDIEFHDQEDHHQPLIMDSLVNFCNSTSSAADFGSFPVFGGSSMIMDNDFGGNPCPSLMSLAGSGSSCFSARTIANFSSHASESADQLTGMVSTATSSTTSPTTIGVNFSFDQREFAPDFTFDNLDYFS